MPRCGRRVVDHRNVKNRGLAADNRGLKRGKQLFRGRIPHALCTISLCNLGIARPVVGRGRGAREGRAINQPIMDLLLARDCWKITFATA